MSEPRATLDGGVRFGWLAAALVMLGGACTDKASPEYIADQFVDAYFRRVDQAAAREYTALGVTEMLDRELDSTRAIRASGYTPEQAAGDVTFRRGSRTTRGERVHFDYDIVVKAEGTEAQRNADLELARIQSAWKVVFLEIKSP